MGARRRWTSWLVKLSIAIASTVLVCLAAEGGHRLWLWLRGTPYSAAATEVALRSAVDPLAEFTARVAAETGKPLPLLHPYTGAEDRHDTGQVLAAFRDGSTAGAYVVVLVGGSVAFKFAVQMSAALEQRLAADPAFEGRRVMVLNYAHHSYKQPQQLARVAYLLSLGYRPDAVIDLDGFNEIALAMANWQQGVSPLYPFQNLWQFVVPSAGGAGANSAAELDLLAQAWRLRRDAERLATRARAWRLASSSLIGAYLVARMEHINRERASLSEARARLAASDPDPRYSRQVRGPDAPREPGAALETCVRNWYESSLSTSALCAARSIAYLHVLQPTLYDAGSKPLTPAEQALHDAESPLREFVRDGYPLLRERGQMLAQHGVSFFDASRLFAEVEEELYVDNCHFKLSGNTMLMEAIAKTFLERMPAPKHQ